MIPRGSIRSITIATKSTAISPITEDESVAITPSIVPNNEAAVMVPKRGRWPPEITVINDLAIYTIPRVGYAPTIGTKIAPAKPVSIDPKPKVSI